MHFYGIEAGLGGRHLDSSATIISGDIYKLRSVGVYSAVVWCVKFHTQRDTSLLD